MGRLNFSWFQLRTKDLQQKWPKINKTKKQMNKWNGNERKKEEVYWSCVEWDSVKIRGGGGIGDWVFWDRGWRENSHGRERALRWEMGFQFVEKRAIKKMEGKGRERVSWLVGSRDICRPPTKTEKSKLKYIKSIASMLLCSFHTQTHYVAASWILMLSNCLLKNENIFAHRT